MGEQVLRRFRFDFAQQEGDGVHRGVAVYFGGLKRKRGDKYLIIDPPSVLVMVFPFVCISLQPAKRHTLLTFGGLREENKHKRAMFYI